MSHPQLTIAIQQIDDERYLAVVSRPNGGEVCRNTFTFKSGQLIDIEPQWMLNKAIPRSASDTHRRDETAAAEQAAKVAELATYGQRLYGFLFGDGADFNAFLRYNDSYKKARITLSMHQNASALWQLPWEYLHDGADFLALSGRFQLSRRPEGMATLATRPVQLPLRILVVVSSPDDANLLDTEEEIGVIQDALDEATRAGRIQVEYLDDATLENIGYSLREFDPHVLHYTGHGAYDKETARSYLLLENEDGAGRLADITALKPHLAQAGALRLVMLSGCQTAQTSATDAFSGVATGMLAEDIPAVVAMQFSILDNSAIQLARAFYAGLARGDSLAEAMADTRVALWQYEEGPGYDWGIPALYLRVPEMRLVDPGVEVGERRAFPLLSNAAGLPLPRHFVGRKAELRQLRRALRQNHVNAVFVRGIGGIGKSSVAAKLIERPGVKLDGVLVIRCHEVDALDIPSKIASFLQGQGEAGHAEAGNLLLHAAMPPAERARQAAQRISGKRYLFVFDNFESVQAPDPQSPLPDPTLRGLLEGFLQANWRSVCLFTGRYQWRGYDEYVGRDMASHIHLPGLTARQTIMMMDNLSRLKGLPIKEKIKLYKKVGGHPKTIELLNGWLATGTVSNLLDDAALDGLLTQEWEDYFLRDLLAQLPAEERNRLNRLAIFQAELSEEALDYAEIGGGMVNRWLDLSLLQKEGGSAPQLPPHLAGLLEMLPPAERARLTGGTARYSVHPVVADYLLGQTSEVEQQELHRWAATFYGKPFVQIARQMVRPGMTVSEENIEQFARSDQGIVGQLVKQTHDMGQARGAVARALVWQRHLFAAGAVDAADDIVNATWSTLSRWGERDRAKGLLRRSIDSLEGDDPIRAGNRAVARMNLATMLMEEGKLDEALATYQAVYETFATLKGIQQMAAVLGQMGAVYQNMGKLDEAIEQYDQAYDIFKELGMEADQAIDLHQLSMLYRKKGDYGTALARSEAAEALTRKVGNQALVAVTLHEQGIIYNQMALAVEGEEAKGYRETAVARFQASLDINRRIGNESGAAGTLGELGKILQAAGQMAEAIAYTSEALAIVTKMNDPAKMAIGLEQLGSIHERQGQYAAALAKYQEALALFQQYAPHDLAITQNNIARVQAKMGSA